MIEAIGYAIKEAVITAKNALIPNFFKEGNNNITTFFEADNVLKNRVNDSNERENKLGGSYGEVFVKGQGEVYEIHHMPANNINGLETNDGPAIRMDKEDHRETASCGNSKEAREYRAEQARLIESGDFEGAMQMDIDDIHSKFGDKYDEAIEQAVEYNKNREK